MELGGVDVIYPNELGDPSQRAKALPNQTAFLRGGTPLACPMTLHLLDCWTCDHSREGHKHIIRQLYHTSTSVVPLACGAALLYFVFRSPGDRSYSLAALGV